MSSQDRRKEACDRDVARLIGERGLHLSTFDRVSTFIRQCLLVGGERSDYPGLSVTQNLIHVGYRSCNHAENRSARQPDSTIIPGSRDRYVEDQCENQMSQATIGPERLWLSGARAFISTWKFAIRQLRAPYALDSQDAG